MPELVNNTLCIAFISSILTLDNTILQIMISRPIVSGTIIGYLLGDIKTGLLTGSLIELIWIRVIPVGELPPNITVITILATYWCLLSSTASLSVSPYQSVLSTVNLHLILIAILVAIPFGIIFKKLEILHRQFNTKLAKIVDREISQGEEHIISWAIFTGLFISLVKSFIFYLLLFPAGLFLLSKLNLFLPTGIKNSLDFTFVILPSVGLAAVFSAFYKKPKT
ncbi:MAG: PTS sugar transporter subunit IIC [Elusimicrobiota bacterium]|nr:PTS sugar transporter subunit IIC [Elusimicrobiota bacterium]